MNTPHEEALRQDGDGYHRRNHAGIGTIPDPAFIQLQLIHSISPIRSVLEIGCSTGFRLEKARQAFGARSVGLEASVDAVAEGRDLYPMLDLQVGIAPRDLERWAGQNFDVVIVGHFMYLLPRAQLFKLAAAVDELVAPSGHIIAMDFLHPNPMSAPYAHHDELRVHKHDPSAPWVWSPTYALVHREVYPVSDLGPGANPDAWQTVDVLRKLTDPEAYPDSATKQSVHEPDRSP